MRLTDLSLRSLPAPDRGQKTYYCDSLKGFGCRISQGGAKTFVLVSGKSRERTTLGRFGIISLAEARIEAKRILAERTLGEFRPKATKFNNAVAQFLAVHYQDKKPRTKKDANRVLQKYFLPRFRQDELDEITTDRLTKLIDKLSPSEANHCFEIGRTFFKWAVRRKLLKHSPIDGLPLPHRKAARERVLDDPELKQVWNAATEFPFGLLVRTLILTGQRRTNIATLRREDIDTEAKTLTFPDTKNRRVHVIPYGPKMQAILNAIPGKTGYVFASPRFGNRAFNDWSHGKSSLNDGVDDWVLHDLRRVFASGLAAEGVDLATIEKLLGHVSNSFGGIVSVYQRHNWLPQMRKAIELWEARLETILKS